MIMYHPYQYFVFMIIVVVIFLIRCCCKCLPDKSRGNIIKNHNFIPTCTFILPPPHALLLKQNLNLNFILRTISSALRNKEPKQIIANKSVQSSSRELAMKGNLRATPVRALTSYNNGTLLPGNYND